MEEWMQPGMACVDPQNQWQWRILRVQENAIYGATASTRGIYRTVLTDDIENGRPIGFDQESFHRALQAGPDLEDWTTRQALRP